MNLTDVKLTDQVSMHEIERHEIRKQDMIISFENKLHYNTACNSF